jgi:hypothetical protein
MFLDGTTKLSKSIKTHRLSMNLEKILGVDVLYTFLHVDCRR